MRNRWTIMFTSIEGRRGSAASFRVAASLDSMVIGEPQILGQLKQYYDAAQQAGTVGAILHRLFHRIIFGGETGAQRNRHRQRRGVGELDCRGSGEAHFRPLR